MTPTPSRKAGGRGPSIAWDGAQDGEEVQGRARVDDLFSL